MPLIGRQQDGNVVHGPDHARIACFEKLPSNGKRLLLQRQGDVVPAEFFIVHRQRFAKISGHERLVLEFLIDGSNRRLQDGMIEHVRGRTGRIDLPELLLKQLKTLRPTRIVQPRTIERGFQLRYHLLTQVQPQIEWATCSRILDLELGNLSVLGLPLLHKLALRCFDQPGVLGCFPRGRPKKAEVKQRGQKRKK